MSAVGGKRAPTPKGHPLWGHTIDFQVDPIAFCTKAHRELGEVVRFRVLNLWWYQISEPDLVYEILVKRHGDYHKARLNKQIFKQFLGKGVLTNDGDDWKRQNRIVRPAFHKHRIDAYGEVMVEYTLDMLDTWRDGETFDFNDAMMELTLRIACKCLFNKDVLNDAPTVGSAMKVIEEVLVDHVNLPLPLPRWFPSKGNRRKIRAIDDIEQIVMRLVAEAREADVDTGDLMSMLVRARYEDGSAMSEKQLRDELMTLVFAGHETTAHALVWIWYLLARHPHVLDRVLDEVDSVLGDRPAKVDDQGELPYLDKVVKEGMRLLPSVWTFMREPLRDVQLGEFRVPKGSQIFISTYVMHRNPRFFPDPERFDPDRWTPEFEKGLPRAAYIPFSMGPRICLGKAFAMMEARLILGTLLQQVMPVLEEGYEPDIGAKLSLMPLNGMPCLVRRRARPEVGAAATTA